MEPGFADVRSHTEKMSCEVSNPSTSCSRRSVTAVATGLSPREIVAIQRSRVKPGGKDIVVASSWTSQSRDFERAASSASTESRMLVHVAAAKFC